MNLSVSLKYTETSTARTTYVPFKMASDHLPGRGLEIVAPVSLEGRYFPVPEEANDGISIWPSGPAYRRGQDRLVAYTAANAAYIEVLKEKRDLARAAFENALPALEQLCDCRDWLPRMTGEFRVEQLPESWRAALGRGPEGLGRVRELSVGIDIVIRSSESGYFRIPLPIPIS